MAKSITPPVRTCTSCGTSKSSSNQPWINKDPNSPNRWMWMIGDQSTGVDSRGLPGLTPVPNKTTGTWWIGNVDTGETYIGVVEVPAPESDTDIFE